MKLCTPANAFLLLNWSFGALAHSSQEPLRAPSQESKSTKALLSLHKSLVEISSITYNESTVGTWLADYLRSQDFTVETQDVKPKGGGRKNVLAYLGKSRKTRALVSSHIDTVPPFWPYERKGDEIWGRGTVDAKGSVATQIMAAKALIASGEVKEGDLALLFVVGEEGPGDGMKTANDLNLSWESAIFGEPTELKLASGHKGILGLSITAKGKAGHSGYPELGRSANAMLIPALAALLKVEMPWSEKYGNTTLNIGKMVGGVAANVIAEDAVANLAIRIADGSPDVVRKIVLDTVGDDLDVEFHGGQYGPVYIDSDVPGFDTIICNYGTDIPNLNGKHRRYLYGPGSILMAHSDHEHLKISDLEEAVEGYKKLIRYVLK